MVFDAVVRGKAPPQPLATRGRGFGAPLGRAGPLDAVASAKGGMMRLPQVLSPLVGEMPGRAEGVLVLLAVHP